MGYDLYPMDTLAAKTAVRRRKRSSEDILVFFEHDPAVAAGYIRENGRQARESCRRPVDARVLA